MRGRKPPRLYFSVNYRKSPDNWETLAEIAKRLPEGNWVHSNILSTVDAAKEWGLRPSSLGICLPHEDLDIMIAYLETRRTMTAIDEHIQAEQAKEDARKAARRGKH